MRPPSSYFTQSPSWARVSVHLLIAAFLASIQLPASTTMMTMNTRNPRSPAMLFMSRLLGESCTILAYYSIFVKHDLA